VCWAKLLIHFVCKVSSWKVKNSFDKISIHNFQLWTHFGNIFSWLISYFQTGTQNVRRSNKYEILWKAKFTLLSILYLLCLDIEEDFQMSTRVLVGGFEVHLTRGPMDWRLGEAGGGWGQIRNGGGKVVGRGPGGRNRWAWRGWASGGWGGPIGGWGGGTIGVVVSWMLVGDGPWGGVLSFQWMLRGLLLSGRNRLWFGVQILAVVLTQRSWLLQLLVLLEFGRSSMVLSSSSSFTYFILFGRKIILAFKAVRRVSNHFRGVLWQRTKIQYGVQ